MTDAYEQTGRPTRRTVIKSAAWSMPVIALAEMAPSASASVIRNLTIVATGPTNTGNATTYWFVKIQNNDPLTIPSGSLKLTVPKSSSYRIADNNPLPWSEVDTGPGGAFVYTYNASLSFVGAETTEIRFEFSRFPPGSTGTPVVNIVATATGFQPASRGLEVPY